MTLIDLVKMRCGIPENISIYDEAEIIPLIQDAIEEMHTAGVPESFAPKFDNFDMETEKYNPRVVTCIACYVQAYRGNDRTDTNKYLKLFRDKVHKLMLEE